MRKKFLNDSCSHWESTCPKSSILNLLKWGRLNLNAANRPKKPLRKMLPQQSYYEYTHFIHVTVLGPSWDCSVACLNSHQVPPVRYIYRATQFNPGVYQHFSYKHMRHIAYSCPCGKPAKTFNLLPCLVCFPASIESSLWSAWTSHDYTKSPGLSDVWKIN